MYLFCSCIYSSLFLCTASLLILLIRLYFKAPVDFFDDLSSVPYVVMVMVVMVMVMKRWPLFVGRP